MRKIIVLITLLFWVLNAYAQVSHGGEPLFLSSKVQGKKEVPVYYSHPPAQEEIDEVKDYNSASHESLQFAISSEVNIDVRKMSIVDTLEEGYVYRLAIVSSNAKTVGVIFSEYHLPYGATLFLYNENEIKGCFTSQNNSSSNKLPVAPLKGDSLIIELFEPFFVPSEECSLIIGKISHGLMEIRDDKSSTTNCEVNINCPDGDDWQEEKRAVCKIIIENKYFCTGTLINNINRDGTPYILTANHCIDNQQSVDESIFIFNYESSSCDYYYANEDQSITGGILCATEMNTDFTLIKLERRIPSVYHPFFAGWSRSAIQQEYGVCIHHPGGWDKKISTHHIHPVTSDCMDDDYNPSNFWIIKRWYHGVTERGSSGSALFNSEHKVIGQLYGGCKGFNNNCFNVEREYSNYGKFSESWAWGDTPRKRLKDWLDSAQTDSVELESLESCASEVSINMTLHGSFDGMTEYVATDWIYTSQNITDEQTVSYTAGKEIVFDEGFEAEEGSSVEAQISVFDCVVSCPGICVERWIANAHIGGEVKYQVLNADWYEYKAYTMQGQLIHSSSGDITNDEVVVWDEIDVVGNVLTTISFFSSCGEEVSKTLILHVSSSMSYANSFYSELSSEPEGSDEIIQIYPNPAFNHFVLSVNSVKPYSLILVDSKGTLVMQWDYLETNSLDIKVSGMPSGIYYATVIIGPDKITKKIMLK